jgi:hypothetical protein
MSRLGVLNYDRNVIDYSKTDNENILNKYSELKKKYNEKCNIKNNNSKKIILLTKKNFLQIILSR